MSLGAAVIESLGAAAYTVTRRAIVAGGVYDRGRLLDALETAVTIRAHVQPVAPGRDTMTEPEGLSSTERIKVWTTTRLYPAAENAYQPDRLVYCGRTWEVRSVEDWSAAGGFYLAVAEAVT